MAAQPKQTTETLFQYLRKVDASDVRRTEEPVLALLRGAPFELKLDFEFESLDTYVLEPRLATYFFRELGQSRASDPSFVAFSSELAAQIQDWSGFDEPVHVELQVDSTELNVFDMLEADDYFVFLSAFSRMLYGYQLTEAQAGYERIMSYSPLVVDKIQLNLNRFCITSRVVAAARAFMTAGIPVDTRVINLGPRLISCSADELQAFVRDVSKDATNFLIMAGVDIYEEGTPIIDRHGQDRSDAVNMIMQAIQWAKPLHEVRPAALLTLCSLPVNRQSVFRGVFQCILSHEVLPDLLMFDTEFTLSDQDAEWICQYSTQWRRANPGRKCCVKELQVSPRSMSGSGLHELLAAVDDAEIVNIGGSVDPSWPSVTQASAVCTSPMLVSLPWTCLTQASTIPSCHTSRCLRSFGSLTSPSKTLRVFRGSWRASSQVRPRYQG